MLAYYGTRLSPNQVETPEGYLICKNAVIGRTGFQTYKGRELDQDELRSKGVRVDDDQDVNLYRDPEEVFSPITIASFEGKSVTDGHPSELVSLDTVKEHEEGQVINVRRGNEPLESGDWPLLADLIIKSRGLIDKIKAGLRELSCGYNYHVSRVGDVLNQVGIIGNHVAVVESARAGHEAAIGDSTTLERFDVMSFLDRVLNANSQSRLTAWAKDAKPEEVASAISTLIKELDDREAKPVATDKTPVKSVEQASDPKPIKDAVDKAVDGDKLGKKHESDIQKLNKLFASDEDADDEDADDQNEEPKEKEAGEDEDTDAEDEDASDDLEGAALTIEPSDRPVGAGRGSTGVGGNDELIAARRQGAISVLKVLKPFVAASKNGKLIRAFDNTAQAVQGKSFGKTSGGYGKFAVAANRRGKDAQDSIDAQANNKSVKMIADAEKMYSERFKARQ